MDARRCTIVFLSVLLLAAIVTVARGKHESKEEHFIIRRSRMLEVARSSSNKQEEEEYIGECTEEHYEEWYLNDFPEECRESFANASSLHELFEVYCDPFCGDIYFDYLDDCGNAGLIIAIFYRSLCTENEKGVPCYNYLTSDDYYNPKPLVDEYCSQLNDTCTDNCYYALDALAVELGCCVNTLYNTTTPDHSTMYQLWEMCDLAKPSYCHTEDYSFAGATNLASNLNVLSISIMVLLMAVMK